MKNINFHFHAVRKKNILHTLYSRIITQTTMGEQRPVSTGALKKNRNCPTGQRCVRCMMAPWDLCVGVCVSYIQYNTSCLISESFIALPPSRTRLNYNSRNICASNEPLWKYMIQDSHTLDSTRDYNQLEFHIRIYSTYTQLSSAICFAVCLFYTC